MTTSNYTIVSRGAIWRPRNDVAHALPASHSRGARGRTEVDETGSTRAATCLCHWICCFFQVVKSTKYSFRVQARRLALHCASRRLMCPLVNVNGNWLLLITATAAYRCHALIWACVVTSFARKRIDEKIHFNISRHVKNVTSVD